MRSGKGWSGDWAVADADEGDWAVADADEGDWAVADADEGDWSVVDVDEGDWSVVDADEGDWSWGSGRLSHFRNISWKSPSLPSLECSRLLITRLKYEALKDDDGTGGLARAFSWAWGMAGESGGPPSARTTTWKYKSSKNWLHTDLYTETHKNYFYFLW